MVWEILGPKRSKKIVFYDMLTGIEIFVQGTVSKETFAQGDKCLRDNFPRRLLSKETFVQGDFVQGDFCPRRLLSKETFVQKDFCPRRLLSKETFVQEDFFQGDFCERNLVSKKALTSDKIAEIDTTHPRPRWVSSNKINVSSTNLGNHQNEFHENFKTLECSIILYACLGAGEGAPFLAE